MTLTRTEAVELMQRHGIEPSRALGQNFVVDPNTVRRIARLAGVQPGDSVIEIGAGLGALTLALVEAGAYVTAVELDRRLAEVLRQTVVGDAVALVEADAMLLDWSAVTAQRLVANLPYNIATPLVITALNEAPQISSMLVMVQREVGERLAASPGSKIYGIPSVKVAFHAHAEVVGTVGPSVFLPQPRVDSALVKIERRPPPPGVDRAALFSLVDTAFGQRRKMLRRSLREVVDEATFERADVRPDDRPEQLDIDAWARLAAEVARS